MIIFPVILVKHPVRAAQIILRNCYCCYYYNNYSRLYVIMCDAARLSAHHNHRHPHRMLSCTIVVAVGAIFIRNCLCVYFGYDIETTSQWNDDWKEITINSESFLGTDSCIAPTNYFKYILFRESSSFDNLVFWDIFGIIISVLKRSDRSYCWLNGRHSTVRHQYF